MFEASAGDAVPPRCIDGSARMEEQPPRLTKRSSSNRRRRASRASLLSIGLLSIYAGPTSARASHLVRAEIEPSLNKSEDDTSSSGSSSDLTGPSPPDLGDYGGYLTYCPCMGRFGNQVSQTLGALSFARRLRRTVLLPPFVEYREGRAVMVPFRTYFNVSGVNEYVPAVPIEKFLAEDDWRGENWKEDDEDGDNERRIWSPERRRILCPRPVALRPSSVEESGDGASTPAETCGAKDGSPFGPFWDYLNVTFFGGDDFFAPLSYRSSADKWNAAYPAETYRVLAFRGAPASFPESEEDRAVQRYVRWTDEWVRKGREWMESNLPRGPVVGVHLRNGADWVRACGHIRERELGGRGNSNMFSSPQCLGYRNEWGNLTEELCLPGRETVLAHVRRAVDEVGAKAVFVATDADDMVAGIREALPQGVFVRPLRENNVHLDLVILSQSSLFLGNCVSSFSAIVARTREAQGSDLPTQFLAFSIPEVPSDDVARSEL